MSRDAKAGLLPLSMAITLDLVCVMVLAFGGGPTAVWIAVGMLHLLAVAAAGLASLTSRSQRALAASLTLTLPVLGAVVAMVTLGTTRRGEVGEVPAREPPDPWTVTVTSVRRITDGLSVWESLMSGSPAERSATVAMLARRADPASIALLRRAVTVGSADVAVDAAMALEDLRDELESRAEAA
jgi:hypothetical protein